MELNQPFKKRIMEQPSIYPPQRTYVRPSSTQYQRQSQSEQYNQHEHKQQEQHLQQNKQSQQHMESDQEKKFEQPIISVPQIIQYEYYEAPMTLNAWTQTNPDDFPILSPSIDSKTETALLAKIRELEESLKAQSNVLEQIKKQNIRSQSPEQVVSNSTVMSPNEIKHEGRTYRLLNANRDTQIEILELSEEGETSEINSPPKVYTLHSKPHSLAEKVYAQTATEGTPQRPDSECSMVSIGPNGTKIPASEFDKMSWTTASIATRKLLTTIFNRETLATHSMTGKASPAFKDLDKPVKGKLNANAVQDIIFIVSTKCGVSAKEVRSAITTKCADENKMLRLKEVKRLASMQQPKRSVLMEINKRKREDKENT